MAEFEFTTALVEEIVANFLADGCVLLRKFVDTAALDALQDTVRRLYNEIDGEHVTPGDLWLRGERQFHEFMFTEKHAKLLDCLFEGFGYGVSAATASRRIDPEKASGQWQTPLGPHLDVLFHDWRFTVNFWIPFEACGADRPSLGVVCAPFADVLSFCGYNGRDDADATGWHFGCFDSIMWLLWHNNPDSLERLRENFTGRIWTPCYDYGDAMMISNWTLHFTHARAGMTMRRENVELRFQSSASLFDVLGRHGLLADRK